MQEADGESDGGIVTKTSKNLTGEGMSQSEKGLKGKNKDMDAFLKKNMVSKSLEPLWENICHGDSN